MELKEVIEKRHSIRVYQKQDVPDEILMEVIALARRCPSAGAIRGFQAIISRQKLYNRIDAPVYLVICTNPELYARRYGDRGRNLYAIQDATIFGAYIQLILVDKGLASCWIGAFNEGQIQKAVDTTLQPVAIIAVGYAC